TEGAEAILRAASSSAQAGFQRSAVRLAAASVQLDASKHTRELASRISREAGSEEPLRGTDGSFPNEIPTTPFVNLTSIESGKELPISRQAVSALLSQDFETLDRVLDLAIAEGCSLAAAERIRSLSYLLQGDRTAALRSFALANDRSGTDAKGTTR